MNRSDKKRIHDLEEDLAAAEAAATALAADVDDLTTRVEALEA